MQNGALSRWWGELKTNLVVNKNYEPENLYMSYASRGEAK